MPRKTKKTTRRGNKEGSIYKRKDGKWCGQVLVGYNDLGKPVRKTFYGVTREEVAEKVSATTHKVFSGELSPGAVVKCTIENLIKEYLWAFKKPTISDVTFEWYLNLCNTHVITEIGAAEIDTVTPVFLQKLFNKLYTEKQLSQRSVKAVRDILNQAFAHAVELKLTVTNPVLGTKIPKASREKSTKDENAKVISKNDRARILQAAENDIRMKTALTMLMFTGMRVGEFLALPWKNVDFENGIITINQALTRKCEYSEDGKIKSRATIIGDTKTHGSNRSFKVAPVVMDVLKEWREALPTHMRSPISHDILAPDSVVFLNDCGEMRTYNGFRTTYRRFMSENNLGEYTLHSYRHTFATMLLESGVNPKIVQKMLGHADIETTLGTYSHVLTEVYDGVADTMEGLHETMLKAAESTVA